MIFSEGLHELSCCLPALSIFMSVTHETHLDRGPAMPGGTLARAALIFVKPYPTNGDKP